ncbi:hypothetical protein [Bosea sp. BK604]|uniref:hypothetical protein n=1 Tax=Bosea sp. BK604 TaxID=2512180 RepID=UPI0010E9DD1C|nr:hypothetical protein [Bosea sp. BK604]TCR69679.1 hypothetical protein EV560_10176 [Bosea sp. BK604]
MNIAALVALALLSLVSGAAAHSWYPYDCCSDRDCWPMGVDADAREPDPRIVPGGYLTHDGIFVAERDTRPSRDGRFHVCRRGGAAAGSVISTSQGVCLFVPRPTF